MPAMSFCRYIYLKTWGNYKRALCITYQTLSYLGLSDDGNVNALALFSKIVAYRQNNLAARRMRCGNLQIEQMN